LKLKVFKNYSESLKLDHQKSNTRKRKLVTLRKFCQFLKTRKKIDHEEGTLIPTPERVERVPEYTNWPELHARALKLIKSGGLELRNSCLIRLLIEGALNVSELVDLTCADITEMKEQTLKIRGKNERTLKLSQALVVDLHVLARSVNDSGYLFRGYNKHKALSLKLTPRGVELLLKHLREQWGFKDLTPRQIRHSRVIYWIKSEKLDIPRLKLKLGMNSHSSLKIYKPFMV
jgi:site-specific recombinase XerD